MESVLQTAKRFASREASNAGRRPRLTVTFTPPAGSGACCTGGGVCELLTEAQCSTAGGIWRGLGTSCDPNPCAQPP